MYTKQKVRHKDMQQWFQNETVKLLNNYWGKVVKYICQVTNSKIDKCLDRYGENDEKKERVRWVDIKRERERDIKTGREKEIER